jgi:hypothetical protein
LDYGEYVNDRPSVLSPRNPFPLEAAVRNAKSDKLNLERFGCTFKERERVFNIDWRGKRAAQASNATIFACLVHVCTKTGPLILLAFEISAVRPLPNYCYFPFDLKRKGHRDYLSRLTKTGEIELSLLTDKGPRKRTHRLTPYILSRATERYANALQEFETIEDNGYDFDSALKLMERHLRIPEQLHRVLLEDTLRELSENVDEAIQTVPNENRALARDIVRVAAEAFLPYYRNNEKTFLDNLGRARWGLTCIIDLQRMFAGDPEGLTKFLVNGIGATLPLQQLKALGVLVNFVVALTKLPFREQSSATTESSVPTIPEIPAGLAALVQSMGASSGIPKDAASKILGFIGLELGGKPGRPGKDYSREYDLKATMSWAKVARQMLSENAELRAEFGGRDFASLPFEQKQNLTHRIREGVKSYAERTGKPFPIPKFPHLRVIPPDQQENN